MADADQQSLADHDLLIFGSSKLAPPIPAEVKAGAPQQLAVTDNEALFFVTRNPFNPGQLRRLVPG